MRQIYDTEDIQMASEPTVPDSARDNLIISDHPTIPDALPPSGYTHTQESPYQNTEHQLLQQDTPVAQGNFKKEKENRPIDIYGNLVMTKTQLVDIYGNRLFREKAQAI